ncbi:hypothetical protein [Methylocapsa palsarum]|uniref:Uncharacterized protein n=1 Tax=Methylocapsa palsarum TaxID=1612308 RepID=A0A1I3WFC0_9HYPH|nr:hypothetical protein [Methylocapsa palsarum]SFK05136.1 hypothetical protein SAMN05444581_101511 [Methylocapsa palsarum]
MILVLCDEADHSAFWAAEALRARGLSPLLLTGADFAAVTRWRHSVGAAGADCELHFKGGGRLRGKETGGVLNRLSFVPAAWRRSIGGPDCEYALQEMFAFYLSWLHALPGPKLNPPTPQGLGGNWRHPSAWAALASAAGLPVAPYRQTSEDDPAAPWRRQAGPAAATLHVVGSRVVGPGELVRSYKESCLRLARAAGATLLGVEFARDVDAAWRMTRASVTPDLAGGGADLADSLAEALTS